MPTLASPCTGHDPLVFERGRCFRCGRYLESEIGTLEEAAESIAFGALAIAVDRVADELRREAADAGYLDTPERYVGWLKARMKGDEERERRRVAQAGKRARRAGRRRAAAVL